LAFFKIKEGNKMERIALSLWRDDLSHCSRRLYIEQYFDHVLRRRNKQIIRCSDIHFQTVFRLVNVIREKFGKILQEKNRLKSTLCKGGGESETPGLRNKI
jgi:hypothetical protein